MNKKFSTLLAAALVAGSLTAEAGIVKVASLVDGTSYVIAKSDGSVVLGHNAAVLNTAAFNPASPSLWKYDSGSTQLQNPSDAANGITVTATYGTIATLEAISATSIKLDGSNYLDIDAPATPNTSDNGVQFATVATTVAAVTDAKALMLDGGYVVVDGTTVKVVDKVEYINMATPTVWKVDAAGHIYSGTKYLKIDESGASLVALANASVFETGNGKLTVEAATGFNKYVNKTTLKLEAGDANGAAADFTTVFSYDEANVANINATALIGFPAASQLIAYADLSSNGGYSNIYTDRGQVKTGFYPTSDFGSYYWTYNSATGKITNQLGTAFTAGEYQEFYLVQGVSGANNVAAFKLMTKDGNYVGLSAGVWNIEADVADAAVFSTLPTETQLVSLADLNAQLGGGFDLSIATSKTGTTDINGADVFNGKLTAVAVSGVSNVYYLKNAKGEYIALNNQKASGTVWGAGNNMDGTVAGFKFTTVEDATTATNVYTKFAIEKADNGDDALIVRVVKDDNSTEYGRLYITEFNNAFYLTAWDATVPNSTWPYVVYGGKNRVDIKSLLNGKFVNIAFANKQAKVDGNGDVITAEKYKVGGVLAVTLAKGAVAPAAEYVPANNVLASSPEAQWAIQYVADGNNSQATFVNRENPDVKVSKATLYSTGTANVYAVTAVATGNVEVRDTIRLSFVENHDMFDGFKYVDPAGLNDTIYNIAAYKAVNNVNNAYWVEKNHSTTHQIGLDGDMENAGEWNLRLATKANNKIDTVFVKSTMSILDNNGNVTSKDDVLAIFPYAVQNAKNNEYVKYDGTKGLEYYVCDKDNKTNQNTGARFALKIQPNGTYQFVTIAAGVMGDKVFAGNASSKGTLDNIANYTATFNDLMLVQPVIAPEYRKVVKEWGDTVKIYRADNSSQVLYEKLDPKSVVKGESFLNIDNVNQFTKINPSMFVDTAYINRGTNTCWQYLLAVEPSFGYHKDDCGVPGHPTAVGAIDTVYGRFLINLMDTANRYEATHQHLNPYVNEVEANEMLAKLGFVWGFHTNDSLYIQKEKNGAVIDTLYMGNKDFNAAKFAFRYVDREAGSFKIQTQKKDWKNGDLNVTDVVTNQGYLRWVNGTVVVTESFENGDVFSMTENQKQAPTSNDQIGTSEVSVIASTGSVIVKGAAGKAITISNILGQVIAKTVLSSDNATISVPAGIVAVAVEGEEAVKAIVK